MHYPKPFFLRFAGIVLPAALALLAAAPAPARAGNERVVCHYTYGGETRTLAAAPVASPYAVAPVAVGSYFAFRVVFQDRPADSASIKVYTYADRDGQATRLIHQAVYAYPPVPRRGGAYVFSGRQFVYEPIDESELEYWCELTTFATKRSTVRNAR